MKSKYYKLKHIELYIYTKVFTLHLNHEGN